jgi:hypothetical protein
MISQKIQRLLHPIKHKIQLPQESRLKSDRSFLLWQPAALTAKVKVRTRPRQYAAEQNQKATPESARQTKSNDYSSFHVNCPS